MVFDVKEVNVIYSVTTETFHVCPRPCVRLSFVGKTRRGVTKQVTGELELP